MSAFDLTSARSCLLVKPSSLGDIVHALPCLPALKAAYPELELRWVVDSRWAEMLEGNRYLDEVILFPRKDCRGIMAAPRFCSWAMGLRRGGLGKEEVVIDLQGLMRSALIAKARGANAVAGPSWAREGSAKLYDEVVRVEDRTSDHAVDRYLDLLAGLGVPRPAEIEFPLMEGEPIDQDLPEGFVLVHPYARGKGKSIKGENLQRLCDALAPLPVVVVGIRPEGEVPVTCDERVIDLTGQTTLSQLVGLCRRGAFVISVDSGPMHIASATAKRVLGIHSWTDPAKVGAYGAGHLAWKGGKISARERFSTEIGKVRRGEGGALPGPKAIARIGEYVKGEL